MAVGVVIVTSQDSGAATTPSAAVTTTATPAATPDPVVSVVPAGSPEPSEQLAAIRTDGSFSVSVLDLTSGESFTYGTGVFDTASIVKVDILAALLHHHEEAGTEMSRSEQSLAAAMIQQSDNTAATALFAQIGGKDGLEAFNTTIGLRDTVVGSNGNWGLTQTTADDQVRLLRVVLGHDTVLTTASQAYAEDLMSHVVDDQVFGVSAAADEADDAALKVGFLRRSTTGLWDVTSIGRVEAGADTYLVAVLSEGNDTYEAGVALVDAVAQGAVDGMS